MKDRFQKFIALSVFVHGILFLLFLRILIPVDGRLLLCLPYSLPNAANAAGLTEWPKNLAEYQDAIAMQMAEWRGDYRGTETYRYSQTVVDPGFIAGSPGYNQYLSPGAQHQLTQAGLSGLFADQIMQNAARIPQALSAEETRQLIDKMLDAVEGQLAGDKQGEFPKELAELLASRENKESLAESIYQQLKEELLQKLRDQALAQLQETAAGKEFALGEESSAESGGSSGSGSRQSGSSSGAADGKNDLQSVGSEQNGNSDAGQLFAAGEQGEQQGMAPGASSGFDVSSLKMSPQELSDLQKLAALLSKGDYQGAGGIAAANLPDPLASQKTEASTALQFAEAMEMLMTTSPDNPISNPAELSEKDITQLAEQLIKPVDRSSTAAVASTADPDGRFGSGAPSRGGQSVAGDGLVYNLSRYLDNSIKTGRQEKRDRNRRFAAPLANSRQQAIPIPENIYLTIPPGKPTPVKPMPLQSVTRKAHAYGAASRARFPIRIDGNLNEWEVANLYRLTGEIQGREGEMPPIFRESNAFRVMWDARGLYVAYWLKDNQDKRATLESFWNGDALELFIDPQNLKRLDRLDGKSLQYWFWPRHFTHPHAFGEMRFYPDGSRQALPSDRAGVAVASLRQNGGYTCEVFLSREYLADLQLVPGNIIGFNYSMNNGSGVYLRWVTNKGDNAAFRPNLWGDLLLMGSDAVLKPAKSYLLPGQNLPLEIEDADQNLNANVPEQITVRIINTTDRSQSAFNLIETSANSGRFVGNIGTELSVSARGGVIKVDPGDVLLIEYVDQFASGGQRDVRRNVSVPVARGTMRFARQGSR